MFELGQGLNARQSPSTDITSELTNTVSWESGQWIEFWMMILLSLFCVNWRVDTFDCKSCFSKLASLPSNQIACSGQLNGSHMNLPSGHVGTDGSRLRDSRLIIEAQDELIALMR
jgi:hypothetical protein